MSVSKTLIATAPDDVRVWFSSDGKRYRVWATRAGVGRYGECSHTCGGIGGISDFDIMVTDAVAAARGIPYSNARSSICYV